jgi:hypothetical protein
LEDINKRIRLNHKINSADLDVNLLSQYGLYLLVEEKNLRACIVDSTSGKCLLLEDYRFSSSQDITKQLQELYEDHKLLNAGYWKNISLSVRGKGFVLIPQDLFDETVAAQYLDFQTSVVPAGAEVHYTAHPAIGSVCVFWADTHIYNWAKETYKNHQVKLVHQVGAFLEGILSQENGSESVISLCVENKYLSIVVTRDKKLQYANSFHYNSPQDFVYFVMFVIDELQLSAEQCFVKLYGEISPDSSIYSLLFKYVRNVQFGQKPQGIQFDYLFDEILEHRYFDLYSMSFCRAVN